jgi:thiol-disulfide isomerase/thioredoxin
MKNVKNSLLVITLLIISLSPALSQKKGYSIDITINGLHDTTVIMGHYLGKSMYPDDTAKLDKAGKGILKGKKTLNQGMYIVYLPDGKYFEFIMGADQEFSIYNDTSDLIKNYKITGSPDNDVFASFQSFMLQKRGLMEELQKSYGTANDEEKEKIRKQIEELGKERINKINAIVKQNPDLFASVFLKATLETDVPDSLKSNQEKAYQYYKKHYFDNFNLSDVRLLYTPLYEDKMLHYLDNVIIQIPDTLIRAVDMILDASRADTNLFRYVLITLFNKYGKSNIMGMDAVQVHIARKYYIPYASWNTEDFKKELISRCDILEPILLGKTAPDVQLRYVPADHFQAAANDTALKHYPHAGEFFKISDVQADFTVLIFWEATCSHCKTAVPQLYKIYQDSLKTMGVKVIAVSTLFGEDGKEKWIDFVNSHQLYDWINAWNPYDYQFKITYDVRTTPQIYILNKQKEIIGKHLGPEDVVGLINAYKKHFKNE